MAIKIILTCLLIVLGLCSALDTLEAHKKLMEGIQECNKKEDFTKEFEIAAKKGSATKEQCSIGKNYLNCIENLINSGIKKDVEPEIFETLEDMYEDIENGLSQYC